MKYLFLVILIFLILLSMLRAMTLPDMASEVPVIHWTTDPNPARTEQIRLFHQWLIKHGHVTADGKPKVELRLDTANQGSEKVIIQGVSGVGSDLWDMGSGPAMRMYHAIGLMADVTEAGIQHQFSPNFTYPAMEPEITIDGRQYTFPCNVYAHMFWVNGEAFEKVGMDKPPATWTLETFESIGREFVRRSNPEGERQTVFFAPQVSRLILARSMGVSAYNETLTASTLDDPRHAAAYQRIYQWTYQDHLLPTAADRESFASATGYGGVNFQLFNAGRFALLDSGRYALIQLREFNQTRRQRGQSLLKLSVSAPPFEHFPNTTTGTRSVGLYVGSPHRELATLFMAFLASEDYNMQIVRDADALPPNPKYTQIPEFTHPPDHPEEWGTHEMFSNALFTIAIPGEHGPFLVPSTGSRIESKRFDYFMNNLMTAEQATKAAAAEVNEEIARTLREDPKLQPLYDQAVALQRQIDEYRAAGKPIPLSWIKNPFHRKYYLEKGWAYKDE